MRHARVFAAALVLLLFLCTPAPAQYGLAPYSIEPWMEDYSYLKDQPPSNDPFDRLKYIPLNADRDWYLTLGGQARWRMDYFNNSNSAPASRITTASSSSVCWPTRTRT